VNVGTYAALTSRVDAFARHKYAALLLGSAVAAGGNFLAAKLYVFRNPVRSATVPPECVPAHSEDVAHPHETRAANVVIG
jgi:hypothetical protein